MRFAMIGIVLLFFNCVTWGAGTPASLVAPKQLQGDWEVVEQDYGVLLNGSKEMYVSFERIEIGKTRCVLTLRRSAKDPKERVAMLLRVVEKKPILNVDFFVKGPKTVFLALCRVKKGQSMDLAVGIRDDYRPKGFDPNKEPIFLLRLKRRVK